MKKYEISFEATEVVCYTAMVEANSPEEALKRFKNFEDEFIDEWQRDDQISCDIDMESVSCDGEWCPDEESGKAYSSSSLKRFDVPIV